MLSVISKTIMFFSSYIPLYIILFVQYIDFSEGLNKQPLLFTLLVIIIMSLVSLLILIVKIPDNKNIVKTVEIRNVKKIKESNLTYLLSNVLPLIAFDFTNKQQIASFLIIFFILLMMYIKYNLIIYNPTMEILGYTNYSAEVYKNDKKVKDVTITSKDKFYHENTFYNCKNIELDNNFLMITSILHD